MGNRFKYRAPGARYLWWGLTSLPILFLVIMLFGYSLDVPYLDQWEFAALLGKAFDGHPTFQDFWGLHNEHRPLFPRLLLLLLARLSHWNILWELWAGFLFGVAILIASIQAWRRAAAVTVRLSCARRTTRQVGWREVQGLRIDYPVLFLLSLLVFSMSQWQNWFFGWQVSEFMQVSAVMFGLLLLDADELNGLRIAGAMMMGIIATFCFASGLVFWPVGFLAVLLRPQTSRAQDRPRVIASEAKQSVRPCARRLGLLLFWALVSLLAVSAYLYRFRAIDYHPAPWRPLEVTATYAQYVLSFLGAPLFTYSPLGAMLSGILGLMLFVALTFGLLRSHAVEWRQLTLPIGLAAFSLGAALMTGFGRVAFGVEQAMSSRYVTLSNPLWIAIVILIGLAASLAWCQGRRVLWRLSLSILTLIAFLTVCNASYGTSKWIERYHFLAPARTELISGDDPAILQRLHPDPRIVLERREALRWHRISIFRE